jgi:gluconate 2-dehydrogenase gamma chain
MDAPLSRRSLLRASLLAGLSAEVLDALQHPHESAQAGEAKLQYLDPQAAAEIEALAAQIIPSDDGPGAKEAGVIYFIDHALATFDQDQREIYRTGLAAYRSGLAAAGTGLATHDTGLAAYRSGLATQDKGLAAPGAGLATHDTGLAASGTGPATEQSGLATSGSALAASPATGSIASIEHSEFFEALRRHVVMGFLASPAWGGNRDNVGWKLIGFEDAGAFQPPFGYYDTPGNME